MPCLTYHTAGESHGKCLIVLVNGLPAGLTLDQGWIDSELRRRQGGYGRGGRQKIETDSAEFLCGVHLGHTTGAPLVVKIANRDARIDDVARTPALHQPRPGHADLSGSIKYLTTDYREILERASARETASRVAAGSLAKMVLRELGIEVVGMVRSIGAAGTDVQVTAENYRQVLAARDASDVYCPDEKASEGMRGLIRQAKIDGDTLGGVCEVHVIGCPPGLGSCMNWEQRLDARIAGAVMSIQAFKGVEIGLGMAVAGRPGSRVHDPIHFDAGKRNTAGLGFTRPSNNAGGIEGGMTNGQPIVVKGAMKPIATLLRPLASVDLDTKAEAAAAYERSDVCAVPAASVVMEAAVAFEVAGAALEKFGGDTVIELRHQYAHFLELARQLPFPQTGQ